MSAFVGVGAVSLLSDLGGGGFRLNSSAVAGLVTAAPAGCLAIALVLRYPRKHTLGTRRV